MPLSLNFIFSFILASISVLVFVSIAGNVIQTEQAEDCINCNVSYQGADCINCNDQEENSAWILLGGIPITLFIVFYIIFSNHEMRIFNGLGEKKQRGGVLPVSLFINETEEMKKEDGWLGIGDFKNDI